MNIVTRVKVRKWSHFIFYCLHFVKVSIYRASNYKLAFCIKCPVLAGCVLGTGYGPQRHTCEVPWPSHRAGTSCFSCPTLYHTHSKGLSLSILSVVLVPFLCLHATHHFLYFSGNLVRRAFVQRNHHETLLEKEKLPLNAILNLWIGAATAPACGSHESLLNVSLPIPVTEKDLPLTLELTKWDRA